MDEIVLITAIADGNVMFHVMENVLIYKIASIKVRVISKPSK